MGPPEDAAKCLRRYGELLEQRDQRLNYSKGWALCSEANLTHPALFALHTDLQVKLTARGIEVLGSPVGNKQFSTDFVMDRIQRTTGRRRARAPRAARIQPAGCQRAGSLRRARTQHSTPPPLSTRSSRAATSWR